MSEPTTTNQRKRRRRRSLRSTRLGQSRGLNLYNSFDRQSHDDEYYYDDVNGRTELAVNRTELPTDFLRTWTYHLELNTTVKPPEKVTEIFDGSLSRGSRQHEITTHHLLENDTSHPTPNSFVSSFVENRRARRLKRIQQLLEAREKDLMRADSTTTSTTTTSTTTTRKTTTSSTARPTTPSTTSNISFHTIWIMI